MASTMEVFNKSSLNERIQQLCNKLELFGVYSDTWINLDTFFEVMNKTRDWRKLDKRIVLQVFNNIDKGLNGTFQIEKFFQTYQQTLNHLQQQKEAAEEYLKKLTNHKTEALKTLDTIQREETANPNHVNSESFLQIEIFEAKELGLNPGEQVYIRLSCEQTNVSTQLVPYLNTARWNERFKIPVRAGAENINILLIAKPISANGRVLGSVQVPLANLKDQQLQDNWFSLAYNDAANSSNKVRIGLQWIYSKTLYLQSTIDKIDQHMRNQVEDIEDYEKEIIEMDNLIPLVVIDPVLSQNELAVRSLVPDHLSPKRLNFETADIFTNSLQSSPNFKPAMGVTLSTTKILSKPAPQSQLASPLVRMTLPTFDQQCSQDQAVKSLASSPRLLNERDPKPIKPQNQSYLLNLLAGANLNHSSSQSNKTFQTLNELPRCESKQNLDNNINEENQKLKAIIEDLKNENETLKQEKQKIASQIPDFEGKIHLLVSEVERLSRTVAEKNKEIETLKTQNERSLREKASTESLDNKLRNVIGENMRLNQHLKRNKEPATGIEKTEQDENIKTQWSPAPRKNQIFSVGPKFHSIENGRIQSAPSQQEIEIPTNYTRQQAPLQIRENKQNTSHTNGFKALMMNSNITFRNNYLQ